MGSMAVIALTGNVGGDPDIRKTSNGEVCSFSLAINRVRGKEEFTDWYRCVTFYDKLIDVVEKFVHKGDVVSLFGEPGQQKWEDKDGVERTTVEVLITKLTLMPKGDGRESNGRDSRPAARDDRERSSSRGRDDRGGRDDRREERGRGRDDRGRDDRRASSNGHDRGRDDRGGRDDRRTEREPERRPGGGQLDRDLDDEVPFSPCVQ